MAVVAAGSSSELGNSSQLDNLCLFEGMEGFEGVNVNDDSSLMALLDDLNEETLESLLDDDLFAKDLSDFSRETRNSVVTQTSNQDDHSKACTDDFLCVREHPVSVIDPNEYLVAPELTALCSSDEAGHDRCVKKARLEVLEEGSLVGREHVKACILHDHSYAIQNSHRQMSSSNSNSDEEGSNSDGGYDTMSSSTSPGRGGKSKAELSTSTPSSIPLDTVVDPVALIDARIKHYMCTREVNLTEEEKETLKAEGLPIPTTLPLTKVEEKALKNVRRKIRNKVAAQESRKRKKEFVQTLEQRVTICDRENAQLKTRVKSLENENRCLLEEVKKLRNMVAKSCQRSNHSKVGTCIMVIVLCFAVFYGGQSPQSWWSGKQSEYATSSVRSRSLLSTGSAPSWYIQVADWVQEIFMNDHSGEWVQSFSETCLKNYYTHCVNNTFNFMDHA